MLAKKNHKKTFVFLTCTILFFFPHLISHLDFSTDFLNFSEPFLHRNLSQLQTQAQTTLIKHFVQWKIKYITYHIIIFAKSYYVNIQAHMSLNSLRQECKEKPCIHIYGSDAHGGLVLSDNCIASLKGPRRNHMSILVTPSWNGALIPFIISSNKYIWDPSDVNSGSEKSMN